MLDATDRSWKRAAAMRKGDSQIWKTLEDATEYHGANRERSFGRHSDEPRQPIFRHPIRAHHVPGMHKDRSVELFGRFPNNVERWMVEVATLGAVTIVIRIDVRADLDTAQAKLSDATLQFARGKIDILQGNCPEPCEVFRISANNLRDVIIQHSRKIERVLRFGPVAEHHRHSREDLHRNPGAIHVFQAAFGIPNVVGDLTEHTLANHHARAAFVTVLQSDESRITVLFVQVRPVTRQNVSMEVDLHSKEPNVQRSTSNAQHRSQKRLHSCSCSCS